MTPAKKSTSTPRQTSPKKIQREWPVWFQPESPLGSAVRYVASLSSKFHWVGIYVSKDGKLQLGAHMGDSYPKSDKAKDKAANHLGDQGSEFIFLVRNSKGKVIAQLEINSRFENAVGAAEDEIIRRVAQELGELWPG